MKTFSALLAFCAENSPVPGEFSAQRPVTRGFDIFFDLHLNKQLSKQSRGWWFEAPSGSLWRPCNGINNRIVVKNVESTVVYTLLTVFFFTLASLIMIYMYAVSDKQIDTSVYELFHSQSSPL